MGALAPVVLSKGARRCATESATNLDSVTYNPVGFILPGVAKWVDRTGGIPLGYPSMTLSVRQPSKASRVCRVQAKIVTPTMEALGTETASGVLPAPTKAYECIANVEFVLPERSTTAQRTELLALTLSALATLVSASDSDPFAYTVSPLVPAVVDFDPPYG